MCNGVGALPVANSHAVIAAPPPAAVAPAGATLGRHLARRLVQIGASDVFAVPGDFNLTLLDYLIAEPGLNLVGCCNELNAGYAADGYARSRGVGACAVTFTVGGLSVLNAIAGAYSENLPVICIVGGPNSNDYGTNRVLHHTIGLPDFSQELRCFQAITCYQVRARRTLLVCSGFISSNTSVTLFAIVNAASMYAGRREQPGRRARADRHGHRHGAKGEQAGVHQCQLQPRRPLSPDVQPGASAPVHLTEVGHVDLFQVISTSARQILIAIVSFPVPSD
jgi:hypothetical protein